MTYTLLVTLARILQIVGVDVRRKKSTKTVVHFDYKDFYKEPVELRKMIQYFEISSTKVKMMKLFLILTFTGNTLS